MTFESIAKSYLGELQRACRDAETAGVGSLEMATRPAVHRFIEALVNVCKRPDDDIAVHHDVHVTRDSKPDWRLEDRKTFGVFCLGDHKSLDRSGPLTLSAKERLQIERYLELGRPVFVFDGIEFLYFDEPGSFPVRTLLVPKPLDHTVQWSMLTAAIECESLFKNLVSNPGFRKWTEGHLVEQLARRAKLLSNSIRPLLTAPQGSGDSVSEENLLVSLQQLQAIVERNHDRSLRHPEQCADFVAQVLTFGLFFVHTRLMSGTENPTERHAKILSFWQDAESDEANVLRPFRAITELLGDCLTSTGWLRDWYADITGLLSHAEYMGTEAGPKDFHALYEQFLAKFSPQVRFDRGAYYTPNELTDWLVKFVNTISQQEFGAAVAELAETVIDPCCGTGGFLESVVRHCVPQGTQAPRLVGFEVLPAPYALAHYRLAEATRGTAYSTRTRVLLTDTLADNLLSAHGEGADGFSDELREAQSLANPPLRIVIGNPPSSIRRTGDSDRHTITQQLSDFRPPSAELSDRQNIQKALNNEAFRFLRWCAQRVLDSGSGIMALVLPGAFAQAISFKNAREWLVGKFQTIYTLELDEDARAGGATRSLFQVQQGRMVLVGILRRTDTEADLLGERADTQYLYESIDDLASLETASRNSLSTLSTELGQAAVLGAPIGGAAMDAQSPNDGPTIVSKVFHLSIASSSVAEKRTFLTNTPNTTAFLPVTVERDPWLFTPSRSYPATQWLTCWPLTKTTAHSGIFSKKCSGVKAAPIALLFHTSEPVLKRRCSELSKSNTSSTVQLIDRWFSGQAKKPQTNKFTPGVRSALASFASGARTPKPYLFRPFLRGWLTDSGEVWEALSQAPGGGTRSRPEVRAAFAQGAVGIAMAPAPKDIGETLTRFAAFAWDLPDNDIAARGNSMIYCDVYPQPSSSSGSPSNSSNLTEEFRPLFAFATDPNRCALYYVFAIVSSSAYLDTFEGVLYASANPAAPPRIPVAADEAVRQKIAALGEKLAEFENFEVEVDVLPTLSVTFLTLDQEFAFKDHSYDDASERLTLRDETQDSLVVLGVPARVMGTRIAGHAVIEKWLRERTKNYLKRTFQHSDLCALLDIITRIERQYEVLERVDIEVSNLLESGIMAPPPNLS